MNTTATVLLSFAVSSIALIAQEKNPRAIVEKAIKAQGGETNIAKLRIMRIKVEGTATLVPGQPDQPFTIEDTWQMPDRYKTTSVFTLGNQIVSQTQVLLGDKGWIKTNEQTQDMPPEAVAEMKEQKYAEDLDRLRFLAKPGVELSSIDQTEVNGKPMFGVLVKSEGHREVKLYFDRASGLLTKRAHQVLDSSSGKEVLQEVVFSQYQDKDGLKHYRKIEAFRDGKKVIEGKVIEIEFFDKLDEKPFTKP